MALAVRWVQDRREHRLLAQKHDSLGVCWRLAGPDPTRVPGSVASAAFGRHWVRDAACITRPLFEEMEVASRLSSNEAGEIERAVLRYVLFAKELQSLKPPRDVYDKRQAHMSYARYIGERHTVGEASFGTGGIYYEPHDRYGFVQLDAPALRSLFLLRHGLAMSSRGESYAPWSELWKVIFADLHYLCHNWRQPCFDVWGEVQGVHYFTLQCIRQVLREAAKVDIHWEEGFTPAWLAHWDETASEVEAELRLFVINGSLWPTRAPSAAEPRPRRPDASALLAHVWLQGGSVPVFEELPLGRLVDDLRRELGGGPLIGRYPDDGYSKNKPWLLTSLALAGCEYLCGRRPAGDLVLETAAETREWLEPGDSQEKGWTHATYLAALKLREGAPAPPLPPAPPPAPLPCPHVCPCVPPPIVLPPTIAETAADQTAGHSGSDVPPSPESAPAGSAANEAPAAARVQASVEIPSAIRP